MRRPDDILEMPTHQRVRLRLRKKFRHYKKRVRPRFSSEELLTFLRKRKIQSSYVLGKTRTKEEPNLNDFQKAFGTWQEAVRLAFGTQIAPVIDKDYMPKAVIQFNMWTVKRFQEVRKIDPVVVPSWRQVKKEFGTYRNLIECARRMFLKGLLDEYRKLIRKLGHIPSLDEIREADLRMDEAIKFYGSKKEMDEFVSTMGG